MHNFECHGCKSRHMGKTLQRLVGDKRHTFRCATWPHALVLWHTDWCHYVSAMSVAYTVQCHTFTRSTWYCSSYYIVLPMLHNVIVAASGRVHTYLESRSLSQATHSVPGRSALSPSEDKTRYGRPSAFSFASSCRDRKHLTFKPVTTATASSLFTEPLSVTSCFVSFHFRLAASLSNQSRSLYGIMEISRREQCLERPVVTPTR